MGIFDTLGSIAGGASAGIETGLALHNLGEDRKRAEAERIKADKRRLRQEAMEKELHGFRIGRYKDLQREAQEPRRRQIQRSLPVPGPDGEVRERLQAQPQGEYEPGLHPTGGRGASGTGGARGAAGAVP